VTLHGNGVRIRRSNQQQRVDAFLEDAERLLSEIFDTDAKLIKNPLLQHRGRTVLRHIVSARRCNNGRVVSL
jgi:hypothetical protein